MSSPFGGTANDGGASPVALPVDLGTRSIVRPNPLPLIVAGALVFVSLVIYLTLSQQVWSSWLGYILTPFGVVVTLVWARTAHLKMSAEIWYDRFGGQRLIRLMQVVTAVAFVVGAFHIWRIATSLAAQ